MTNACVAAWHKAQLQLTIYYTVTSARTSGIYLSGKEFDVVVESNIFGFHFYKDAWIPVTGEVLTCESEDKYSFEPSGASVIYWM